jgi:DNA-binding transcriptional LysR family regulator
MPGQLDWDDLRHFLAIVARGSISGAATLLKVNHSTVLRRITALEDHLQLRLFDRLPAGYTLTAEGRALADGLAGVQEHIETAQRGLQGGDLAVRGVLRLTTTDTLLQGLLLPLLARFHALHPAVQLEIVVNNSFLNLTQREADVAVRGSNQPPENLVGRRVGNIQTALHAAQSYLPALGTPPDVAQARWVALDESLAHLEQARWLRARRAGAHRAARGHAGRHGRRRRRGAGRGDAAVPARGAAIRARAARAARPGIGHADLGAHASGPQGGGTRSRADRLPVR